MGKEFDASLIVDEGLDCAVIELRDGESVVHFRFRVEVVCESMDQQ